MLADRRILFSDQARLSVHHESETAIQRWLEAVKGRSTIIIAHRFPTIREADLVFVLDE